ncbi:family 10 glycosylhydrolase [candidate division KSB1 bacterium]
MKKVSVLYILLVLFVLGCARVPRTTVPKLPDQPVAEIPAELRGIWITRFDWTNKDPDVMRNRIIDIMEKVSDTNFNAVFFQVRGQAETLYPSPFEPWSVLLDFKDPGFDPVALAVGEAHKHGLKFYAYINLLPMWSEESPPANEDHLFHAHGPLADENNCWVCYGADGRPMQFNEYYYMNPALPEVKSYLKKVLRHFVSSYDIDGVHFDRVRYPGPDYLYDPYSARNFRADSLVSGITRDEWARRQLTDIVEDVVAGMLTVKPYLHISAATWGLYKTKDVKGYEHFNSGYKQYYQDAVDWLDRGIMDFIVPMIYWDVPEPKPNFHELWDNFRTRTPNYRYIFPGLRARTEWVTGREIFRQVQYARRNEGMGHVMFSYSAISGENELDLIKDYIYPNSVKVPDGLKRLDADRVVSLKFTGDNNTALSGTELNIRQHTLPKTTDADGRIGLILPERPDRLDISLKGSEINVSTRGWLPPFRYTIAPDGSVSREAPWLEFRRIPDTVTNQPDFDLLCKTEYPAETFINGQRVKMYSTGIFFDTVNFREGPNRVKAEIITPDSESVMYEREFFYRKEDFFRKPFPLWIDETSAEPSVDHVLIEDDVIRISVDGSKGQSAFAEITPGNVKVPLVREDFADYSRYTGDITLKPLKKNEDHSVTLIIESTSPENKGKKHNVQLEPVIRVQKQTEFPLVRVSRPGAVVSYNLGEIRLGGPVIAEYPPGVVIPVTGMIGDAYRVFLNANESGFISRNDVEVLPEGTSRPGYYLQSMSVAPRGNADVVSIPYPEPVPYAVVPEPDQNRIVISLYGVKTSSTWITHREGLKTINKVTWDQPHPDTYRVIVNLNSQKIWGYELAPRGASLELRIKHPPVLFRNNADLLIRGLKVAIEAGHGGSSSGAVGLSGLVEKDINLDVSRKLEEICRQNEVEVFQIRETDTDISIGAKREMADRPDTDIVVSIHANAAGGRGYLRVAGVSTYYNNPFWAEFAEIVYTRLLEAGLDEFGVVGSFNYRVIRLSSKPAILVEQAFLSHAEDEEKLFSEEFRQQIAQKIFDGIADYVAYMMK